MKRVVIVGGGTAGWLAACVLAAKASRISAEPLSITLIEAPNIPTIGVGEGTWPTMRATLSGIGLDEADVLTSCDAAFKQGSRFDGWVTGGEDDFYYHPFTPAARRRGARSRQRVARARARRAVRLRGLGSAGDLPGPAGAAPAVDAALCRRAELRLSSRRGEACGAAVAACRRAARSHSFARRSGRRRRAAGRRYRRRSGRAAASGSRATCSSIARATPRC